MGGLGFAASRSLRFFLKSALLGVPIPRSWRTNGGISSQSFCSTALAYPRHLDRTPKSENVSGGHRKLTHLFRRAGLLDRQEEALKRPIPVVARGVCRTGTRSLPSPDTPRRRRSHDPGGTCVESCSSHATTGPEDRFLKVQFKSLGSVSCLERRLPVL